LAAAAKWPVQDASGALIGTDEIARNDPDRYYFVRNRGVIWGMSVNQCCTLTIALLVATLASGITGARAGSSVPNVDSSGPINTDRTETAQTSPAVPPSRAEVRRIDWNGDNFFGPCQGDCSFALYGG